MAQDSKSFSQEESEETPDDAEEQRTQPYPSDTALACRTLWVHVLKRKLKTYIEPAATPACKDKPVGSLEGEEAAREDTAPAQALPHFLPSRATAAPALLQVPVSAQAEDALLSTVIPPLSSLNFGWIV